MRAIQTEWKGYKFRSRLEARWAVFFDRMGLQWEYEPEGFELGGLRYLPDFRVTSSQGYTFWYEIKPRHTAADPKFDLFRRNYSGASDCSLLSGDPVDHLSHNGHVVCPRCGNVMDTPYSSWDMVFCSPCDQDTPCGGDNEAELTPFNLWCTPHKGTITMAPEWLELWLMRVNGAAVAARQARFEHGEAPE